MKLRPLLYGAATFIPGVSKLRAKGTGGTESARYCYSVWLRHLVKANNNGLNPYPKVVAELGPGDSLGIGITALISGSEKYFALDVIQHVNTIRNLSIFYELINLFKNKTPIPNEQEFPLVKPFLDDYKFPSHIFDDNRLKRSLETKRLRHIKNSLERNQEDDSIIQYKVPWNDSGVIETQSVDMIFSQAVLEHVDDLPETYRAMYEWLKPIGYMSHTVDFKSHGTATQWNGHWLYSDFVWRIIRGKRRYLLNRISYSKHLDLMDREGFSVVYKKQFKAESTINRKHLPLRFKSLSEDDLTTQSAFVQSTKKLIEL